ncbi:MAG: hypothetical protein ACM3SU_02535 [Acidobacteriota bacterium]
MRFPGLARVALPAVLLAAAVSCKDNNDVTGAPGAFGSLTVTCPDSAVSGHAFNVDVKALNVGISGIHNGMVQITLPAPLSVNGVTASPGTSATFTAGSATWTLNTLDSNTQSTLAIATVGTLPAGSPAQTARISATMTADGIKPGDATAFKDVQITP